MSRDRTRQWDAQVADWKESRRQAGRPVPDGPPIPRLRPNYAAPVGAAMEGEVRPQLRNDAEQLIGTVVEYLAQLPPGEGSSRRGYDDWAAKRPGTPYGSTFDRHGGWAHMRRLAQQQMKGPAAAKPTAAASNPPAALPWPTRPGPGRKARVSVGQLVDLGLLSWDEQLAASYKGQHFTATINPNTGVVTAVLDARESTGLTRPDYFNWPAELSSDLGTTRRLPWHPGTVGVLGDETQ